MTTMMSHVMLSIALVCGASIVRATPVFAQPDIIQFLSLEERCLFLCNICFDQKVQLMGVCANTVCPKIDMNFFGVNQWISKRCQSYESLLAAFFPKDTQSQI